MKKFNLKNIDNYNYYRANILDIWLEILIEKEEKMEFNY